MVLYIDRYPNSISDWRLNHLQKSESHWVWSSHEPRHVQVARGEHEAPGGKPSESMIQWIGLIGKTYRKHDFCWIWPSNKGKSCKICFQPIQWSKFAGKSEHIEMQQ